MPFLHRSRAEEVGSRRPPRVPASIRPEADRNPGGKRVQRVGDIPFGSHQKLPEIPKSNLADGICEISWQIPSNGIANGRLPNRSCARSPSPNGTSSPRANTPSKSSRSSSPTSRIRSCPCSASPSLRFSRKASQVIHAIFRAIPKKLVRLTRRRECQLQLNPKSLLSGPRRSVGRGKISLCALLAPVSDASLQHKNCLGREFGKRPLPVKVSLSQSHGALAFPSPPPSPPGSRHTEVI